MAPVAVAFTLRINCTHTHMSMYEENDLENGVEHDDGYISPENPTIEDYRKLEKANRRLFARAKKAEGKATPSNEASKNTPSTEDAKKKEQEDAAWRERVELKTEGYSDEEVAYLQQNGGRKALENGFVKAGINAMREQKKAEQAAVESTAGKSEIEKLYTDKQL